MRDAFTTYFLQEAQRISGLRTTSVRKLFAAAAEGNVGVVEPLFFYALGKGRTGLLLRCAEGTPLEDEYRHVESLVINMTKDEVVDSYNLFPWRYRKALKVYRGYRARPQVEADIKDACRTEVMRLLQDSGLSCRQACRELSLNQGNVSAWLRTGEGSKLGLRPALKLRDHLRERQCGSKAPERSHEMTLLAYADGLRRRKSRDMNRYGEMTV